MFDGDAEDTDFHRQRPREAGQASLCRNIVSLSRNTFEDGSRADVHDPAPALSFHERQESMDHLKTARQIDSDDLLPLGQGHLLERDQREVAGTIDQNIDPAMLLPHVGGEGSNLRYLSDVRCYSRQSSFRVPFPFKVLEQGFRAI